MTYNFQQQSLDQWNFSISETLKVDKSSVLLVKCNNSSSSYILKVFPKDDSSYYSYLREQHFHSLLSHPNVIQYITHTDSLTQIARSSAILMEYARHGDLFNFITSHSFTDEQLIRSYFHQLIDGLQHIHSSKIAHLDLKLDNLLLDADFRLKISDFDLAQDVTDSRCISNGTENYRAPELMKGNCKNYHAADVYSAGICLFALFTGAYPFNEQESDQDYFRFDTFEEDNESFWIQNEVLINGRMSFTKNLKDLLNKMWERDPSKRITLDEIKKSRWYNGPVYSEEEVKEKMQGLLMQ